MEGFCVEYWILDVDSDWSWFVISILNHWTVTDHINEQVSSSLIYDVHVKRLWRLIQYLSAFKPFHPHWEIDNSLTGDIQHRIFEDTLRTVKGRGPLSKSIRFFLVHPIHLWLGGLYFIIEKIQVPCFKARRPKSVLTRERDLELSYFSLAVVVCRSISNFMYYIYKLY